MNYIYGDILNISRGIIAHQVNCQGVMGAGVAKAISEKYPQVKEEYLKFCQTVGDPDKLFGQIQPVRINDDLMVANIFSQKEYGNAKVTGVCYTSEDALVAGIVDLLNLGNNTPVYIPGYIGCGLAGGNWKHLLDRLSRVENHDLLTVVYLGEDHGSM